MIRKISSILFLAIFFASCATDRALKVEAGIGHPNALTAGVQSPAVGGYTADGYTVIVFYRDNEGKPTYIKDAIVTCEASNPSRKLTKVTDADGRAHFSVRGKASFWVDYVNRTYRASSIENSDTVANQSYVVFELSEE